MGNVEVAYEDVISVIQLVRTHIIVLVAALLCMAAVMVIARKWEKPVRGMIRWQSLLAFLVVTVLTVNVMLSGALYNTLNIVLADKGELSPENADNSRQIIEEITNEGIVMTKNEGAFLPIAPKKINVFGWASTNPIYGGTGSGTVDASTAVGILEGLQNAGFETNDELSEMYVEYRADRPLISINDGQDWTLPEVPAAQYSEEIMANAKEFSDTAVIVIARTGGEGADLPHDMGAVMDGSYQAGTKYTNASYANNGNYDDFGPGSTYLELSRTEADLVDLVCGEFDNVIVVYNGANALELGWTQDYEQIKSVLLCAGAGAYVLEDGAYEISLRQDSHHVIDTKVYELDEDIVYDASRTHAGDLVAAENRMQFAEGTITYLSRENGFENYEEAVKAPESYELDGEVQGNGTWNPQDYNDPSDEMPVTGADNGMELYDLRGADYGDPRWEELLDQVTVDEMVELIAYGGHQTAAVASVGKLRTLDTDGPAGLNSTTIGAFGTGYCSEVLIAQTWNEDLAAKAGEGISREFSDLHVTGWYAPSMNLHRSAFGGRNFEYYSEDSLLSSRMAFAEVSAAVAQGVYPYIKHLVLNEQETNRNALLCTWFQEQSLRELYLKPFEYCVKNTPSGKLAVMSSYNFLGTEWAGGCSALLKDILRDEWGFEGMVISDYFGNYGYMDADRAVRGGTDLMLGTSGNEAIMTDLSATSVTAMRQAAKNIFYVTVNSNAYENYVPGTIPSWMRTMYMVDAGLAILLVLAELLLVRSWRRKKKCAITVETAEKEIHK